MHRRYDVAREAMNKVSAVLRVDFADLEYISSAGLGVLLGRPETAW